LEAQPRVRTIAKIAVSAGRDVLLGEPYGPQPSIHASHNIKAPAADHKGLTGQRRVDDKRTQRPSDPGISPFELRLFHLFTPERFHALLNSLFRVLFNFPSRYLFTIGLVVIFSLRRSLPPTLGCTFKQPDSAERTAPTHPHRPHGPCTLYGQRGRRFRSDLDTGSRCAGQNRSFPNTTFRMLTFASTRFGAGLLPFHSPLLRESLLFSFPPLINMLKFGG